MRTNLALFVVRLVSFAFALPLNTNQPPKSDNAQVLVSPISDLTLGHTNVNARTFARAFNEHTTPVTRAIQLQVIVHLKIPIAITPLTTDIIDDCLQAFLRTHRRQFHNLQFSIRHIRDPNEGKQYQFDFEYAQKMYKGTLALVRQTTDWVFDSVHSNIHEVDGPHL
ncbi:hypothetical protein F5876DRAFT_80571 [Lentinula aff. lateritia]|uniref:Uncharacterized protein n=1 Tax=Lentinula aff. lateritia TaxID=2804960 RepID=A0ACC1TPC7_9AGAR|nr:hypothetical protein F5876DRAFT_80571 [Lentinula aff. lateritia]